VSIAGIVLAQIASRMLGSSIPSTDDFAAWAMAGAVFLALPSAFFYGKHIKVTLVIDRLNMRVRQVFIRGIYATTLVVFVAATWYASIYVYESYIYGDTSQGIVAIPLWIPQILMLAGMIFSLPVLLHLMLTGTENEERRNDR